MIGLDGHAELEAGALPSATQVAAILREERQRALGDAMGIVVSEVRASIPRRTGRTAERVTYLIMVVGDQVIGQFIPGSKVLEWLEEGTGIYGPQHEVIRPRNAQALRFRNRGGRASGGAYRRGSWAFAAFVRGIKPRKYVEHAFTKTEARRQAALERGADRAAARIERARGRR
jgi:hypothetical protein